MTPIELRHMGVRIRELRKQRRMTQKMLAQAAGISLSTLAHIERGSREMSLSTLVSIGNILGISLDYLVNGVIMPPEYLHGELLRLRELEQNMPVVNYKKADAE